MTDKDAPEQPGSPGGLNEPHQVPPGEPSFVVVRRWLDDPNAAVYRISDIGRLNWRRTNKEATTIPPVYCLSALVWCDEAREGAVKHSCLHGPKPHRIRMVVLPEDNELETYGPLAHRATTSGSTPNGAGLLLDHETMIETLPRFHVAGARLGAMRSKDLNREANALMQIASLMKKHKAIHFRQLVENLAGVYNHVTLMMAISQLGSVQAWVRSQHRGNYRAVLGYRERR